MIIINISLLINNDIFINILNKYVQLFYSIKIIIIEDIKMDFITKNKLKFEYNTYLALRDIEIDNNSILYFNDTLNNDNLDELFNFLVITQYILNKNTKNKILDLFLRLIKILNLLNIQYWLEGGTLLGAARSNKIIKWDDDIDISILLTNEHLLLNNIELFNNENIRLKKNKTTNLYWQIDNLYKSKNDIDPNIHIDIFLYEKIDDIYYNTDFRFKYYDKLNGHCNNLYKYSELFPLKYILFENIIVSIPNKYNIILSNSLGKDYKNNAIVKHKNKYITSINLDSKFGKLLK